MFCLRGRVSWRFVCLGPFQFLIPKTSIKRPQRAKRCPPLKSLGILEQTLHTVPQAYPHPQVLTLRPRELYQNPPPASAHCHCLCFANRHALPPASFLSFLLPFPIADTCTVFHSLQSACGDLLLPGPPQPDRMAREKLRLTEVPWLAHK